MAKFDFREKGPKNTQDLMLNLQAQRGGKKCSFDVRLGWFVRQLSRNPREKIMHVPRALPSFRL